MYWFTSDTHYGHRSVISYSSRPFASVEEMDEMMIARWNATVSDKDIVYHLGDFAFCKREKAVEIAKRLNGHKHLVFGNHDKAIRKDARFLDCWESVNDLVTVKVQDATAKDGVQRIVLCHYAMKVWDRSHYGAWQLYGHSHGSMPDDPHSLSLDVGVDCWGYRPVRYEELKQRMALKTWEPIDGHTGERE